MVDIFPSREILTVIPANSSHELPATTLENTSCVSYFSSCRSTNSIAPSANKILKSLSARATVKGRNVRIAAPPNSTKNSQLLPRQVRPANLRVKKSERAEVMDAAADVVVIEP